MLERSQAGVIRSRHLDGHHPRSPDPAIRFTLSVNLPADVVRQVLEIPDSLISIERGA